MAGVLLFGGSFDPVHCGHLIVSRAAAELLSVERIILIPSAQPPHKERARLTAPEHRVAMCRAAVAGDPLFEVSDWEVRQPGPNYTLLTVNQFRAALGAETPLYWLLGGDSLRDLHTWYRVAELADACTLVTAGRPGHAPPDWAELGRHLRAEQLARLRAHVLATPQVEIAATQVRQRVAAGLSVRYLVPEPVRDYISAQRLYRA